ncbi:hypothetical protein N865_07375 [Intrasporangium oryzae NRRL B-24470]|uniref:DUF6916 domain-containing protein n=1 Tax=Intrasporangium oryzae NRRL B-24470 TaxID=1386089 RepID=W9GA62_9MICO|nr:hypothetical protein [Intrasporangium oryzae]EWT02112.1 hypothetical protein N865_07375 [Intrasporangium oryzae NRRL B-24470]
MVLSRRSIVLGGPVAVATTLVPTHTASAATSTGTSGSLLSRSRFASRVGASFTLTAGGTRWSVTLSRVTDVLGAPPGDDRRFAVTFTSPSAGPSSGTWTVSRPGFTATTLFGVAAPDRRSFTAVVNRI